MATMISEVYQAFITAGVPHDQARQAAEALSSENLATKADIQLLDKRVDDVQAQLSLLKWMLGFNLAFTMAVLWKIIA